MTNSTGGQGRRGRQGQFSLSCCFASSLHQHHNSWSLHMRVSHWCYLKKQGLHLRVAVLPCLLMAIFRSRQTQGGEGTIGAFNRATATEVVINAGASNMSS